MTQRKLISLIVLKVVLLAAIGFAVAASVL